MLILYSKNLDYTKVLNNIKIILIFRTIKPLNSKFIYRSTDRTFSRTCELSD